MWDELLALTAADPDYRFLMDGQTVVIDDYLAVRPQALERLRRAVAGGQVQVGPWYTLPDEFLVSGETLVRNLERGIAVGDAHGGAIRVGYLPDSFGHAAQMPQIYRQFGFSHAVVWRGVPASIDRLAFEWEAPDGSRILTAYLGTSYSHGVDLPTGGPALAERVRAALKALEPFHPGPDVLLMNGNDHVAPQRGLSAGVRAASAGLPDVAVRLSRLDEYLERLPAAGWPLWPGELRASSRANILMGTLSVRVADKQAYFQATRQLERRAEPLAALTGLDVEGLLREAWTLVLQNAAHDTACGSGVDAVAEEARVRSHAALQIAAWVAAHGLARLRGPTSDESTGGAGNVLVWNPSPFPREGLVEVHGEAGAEGTQDLGPAEPQPAPGEARLEIGVTGRTRRRLLVWAGPVPGGGLGEARLEARPPDHGAVSASADRLENDRLRCEVAKDGTLAVHDLQTDTRYASLHQLEDEGDAGDEYNFSPVPLAGEAVGRPVGWEARCLEAGPLRGCVELRLLYRVPAGLTADRQRRLEEPVELPVVLRVRLEARSPQLDCELEVINRASDHRLRVLFPLPFAAAQSDADTAFHVTRRPARPPRREEGAPEWELPTYPMRSFVDAGDGARGLALITEGLHEYELLVTPRPALALTLLRAVGWLSRDDLRYRIGHAGPALPTPGAQAQGTHRFRYSLRFHPQGWEAAGLWRAAECTRLPLEVVGSGAGAGRGRRIELKPESTQMTACIPRPYGYDLRLLNASGSAQEAWVLLEPVPSDVTWTTIGGVVRERLSGGQGGFRLPLRPWEIATLRVTG